MTAANNLIFVLTLLAAMGAGLIGGAFFAFSSFVMKALGRLPPAEGLKAMQSINVVVLNPVFLGVLVGTVFLGIVVIISSLLRLGEPGSAYLIAGSLLYIVGTFMVTMIFNVPLNNVLAAADPASADGAKVWENYLNVWTFWNHVRTLAALAGTASLTLGLVYRGMQ